MVCIVIPEQKARLTLNLYPPLIQGIAKSSPEELTFSLQVMPEIPLGDVVISDGEAH